MAEATTADLLKVNKDTNKKVSFISNVLAKNIVPASQQKERDIEANAFKSKLLESLSSLKESLKGIAKRTVQVAGFPIALIFGAIAFIIAFFTEIGRQLAKLKAVLVGIKNLPQTISGIFAAIRGGLAAARDAAVLKVTNALKTFKQSKSFKLMASGVDDWRAAFNVAREGVGKRITDAAKLFRESKVGGRLAGLFTSVRNAFTGPKGIITTLTASLPGAAAPRAGGPPGRGVKPIGQVLKGLVPGTGVQKPVSVAGKMADVAKSIRSAIFGPVGKLGGIVGGQITSFKNAALNSKPLKGIAGAFDEVGRIFGRVVGVASGGPPGGATGGIIGALRNSMLAFRESAVFKAFAGIG